MVTGQKPNPNRIWLPNAEENISEEHLKEYFGMKRNVLEGLRSNAIESIKKAQAGFLAKQQEKHPPINFHEGQKVWLKEHDAQKFQPRYKGPYEIMKLYESTALIQDRSDRKLRKDEREKTVHLEYLKPFYDRTGSPARPVKTTERVEEQPEERRQATYFPDEEIAEVEIDYGTPAGAETMLSESSTSDRVLRSSTRNKVAAEAKINDPLRAESSPAQKAIQDMTMRAKQLAHLL